MLAELIIVTFLAVPPNAEVRVHTDGVPSHWRSWPVRTTDRLYREERCRFRVDAKRVLLGRPLTEGVPRVCDRHRELRPDPSP